MRMLKVIVYGLLFLLAACTTGANNRADMSKYEFDNLQLIDSIPNWSLNAWNSIDERSLIVQTSPRRYYLLVLNQPNPELRFAFQIAITSTGRTVRTGFDTVSVPRTTGIRSSIAKIYLLEDKEQADAISLQIQQIDNPE